MTDLVPRPTADIDNWIPVLADVGQLARSLADTDFVPQAMRGRPAAVAAAILSARELGLGPMTGLAHLHVVKGKVGMSAQLMRQLILAAGHDLRYLETTDTRCVVEGRRRGSEDWTRVTFTADQAKRAGVQNMNAFPEDMLVARATSRLARRVFADCLGGVPYLAEELEDGTPMDADAGINPESGAGSAAPAPARRTVQRRPRPPALTPTPPALPAPDTPAPTSQAGRTATETPSLDPTATPALTRVYDDPPLDEPPDPQEPVRGPTPVNRAQLRAIATAMGALGYRERGERLRLTARLVGRDVDSGSDLTSLEASALLDTLARVQAADDPQGRLTEILDATAPPLDPADA